MGFLCSFGACPGTSSCRPDWPWTHRDLSGSASWVLGLKSCATTAQLFTTFFFEEKRANTAYFKTKTKVGSYFFPPLIFCTNLIISEPLCHLCYKNGNVTLACRLKPLWVFCRWTLVHFPTPLVRLWTSKSHWEVILKEFLPTPLCGISRPGEDRQVSTNVHFRLESDGLCKTTRQVHFRTGRSHSFNPLISQRYIDLQSNPSLNQ